jgi:hypothetical protein
MHRQGWMAGISQQSDVTFHPCLERVMHAQLLLAHLVLGHELQHTPDSD